MVSLIPESERQGARVLCGVNTASARHDELTAIKEVVDRSLTEVRNILICLHAVAEKKEILSRVPGVYIY